MTTLTVALAGRPVADLTQSAAGELQLRWRDDYRAEAAATPLSLSLRAAESAAYDHDRVAPWLRGLLPDDPRLIAHWVATGAAADPTPFALVASPVGRDCAGAVSFHPPGDTDHTNATGEMRWLCDGELAALLFELQLAHAGGLGWPEVAWFTLAGSHPKVALTRRGDRWGVPGGATPTTHILKPPQLRFEHHDINEHLCLAAARNAGLTAARSSIAIFEDQTALAVERFDRVTLPDGAIARRHQEDLCGALGYPPTLRYQERGGPTPAQIAGLLRARAGGDDDVWRFADALAYTWLIAAPGAHARNYAVLLDGPQAVLAPLYDVASLLPYDPGAEREPFDDFDGRVRLAMDIGGDYQLSRITATHWRRTALDLDLDADGLVDRILALAGRLPAAFEHAAADPAVRAVAGDFADRFCDLIARRTARLGARLDAPTARDGTGRSSARGPRQRKEGG